MAGLINAGQLVFFLIFKLRFMNETASLKAASIKPASSGNKNWLQLSFAFDFLILLKSINQKLEWKQPVEFQLQSG